MIRIVFLLILFPVCMFAQISANQYFASIYSRYQNIEDMQAVINFTLRGLKQQGTLLYKFPDKFIISLDSNNQVFVSDGEFLTVYVPSLGTVFKQQLTAGNSGGSFMQVLNSEYSVSYANSPNLEALDASSPGEFIKLIFSRKLYRGAATINSFFIAFTKSGAIRRIIAYPIGNEREIIIDLISLKFNVGIPDTKFKYDPPKSSNMVDNFLYDVKKN